MEYVMSTLPGLVSAKEAAALLAVAPRTIYELAAPGGPIPCYRIGRALRFAIVDLESYMRTCRQEPVQKSSTRPLAYQKLKPSDPLGEDSDLVKLFKSHGITPRTKL
jgi:excisionase family DNA binding protein